MVIFRLFTHIDIDIDAAALHTTGV